VSHFSDDFYLGFLYKQKLLQTVENVFILFERTQFVFVLENSSRPVPSFRCTCYRSGEELHSFGSMDVAKSFGGALHVRAKKKHLKTFYLGSNPINKFSLLRRLK
jgi:hypothetical protein